MSIINCNYFPHFRPFYILYIIFHSDHEFGNENASNDEDLYRMKVDLPDVR